MGPPAEPSQNTFLKAMKGVSYSIGQLGRGPKQAPCSANRQEEHHLKGAPSEQSVSASQQTRQYSLLVWVASAAAWGSGMRAESCCSCRCSVCWSPGIKRVPFRFLGELLDHASITQMHTCAAQSWHHPREVPCTQVRNKQEMLPQLNAVKSQLTIFLSPLKFTLIQ